MECNEKVFSVHISSILYGALVGAVSLAKKLLE
jgi:hypothetical protein